MDFFEDLKGKAQNLTQVGVSKSKHLVEVAKLKMASAAEAETIRKAYQEMGKLYYAERGMAPEPAYTAHCEKVQAARAAIRKNNEALLVLKNEGVATEADFEDIEDMAEEVTEADFQDIAEEVTEADFEEPQA